MRNRALVLGTAWLVVGSATLFAQSAPKAGAPAAFSPDSVEFFEKKVRPVLAESCVKCHGTQKQSSGLRLDSREAMLAGGDNGPAVVPGDPEKSLLVQAVRYAHDDIKMPPRKRLPDAPVEAITTWVKLGAPWSHEPIVSEGAKAKASETHWAFQPVREAAPPPVKNRAWGSSPIDTFVLAKLEAQGMSPSPRADKRTLIRRATFDLTGLPPTAEEIAAFEADTSSGAFARVVDRLLSSPHYGERWGRHWLDVARYADTKGYVFMEERRYPYSYTYRDYVVRAFNDDLPYDRFLVEQVAADRLPPGPDNHALAALGFLTVGRRFLNDKNDIIDDRIDVVSRGLLGLTVTCARCHDHKYDPIPSEDYYSLYGVFASITEPADAPLLTGATPNPESLDFEKKTQARQKEIDAYVSAKLEAIQADLRGRAGAYLRAAFDLNFNGRDPKLTDRAKADGLVLNRLRWAAGRWQKHLEATRKTHDPIFAPWHAFAAIPAPELSKKAPEVAKSLLHPADPKKPVSPLLAKVFADKPPASLKDVVAQYALLLDETDRRWRERLKSGPANALPEPEWESLRQVLYGPTGPLTLPAQTASTTLTDETKRLLDRQERQKLTELTNRLAELRASHPGAPARAMVVADLPNPVEPHVFIRGNPGRPGKAVPRRFLKLLSGPAREPFKDGSGRLELARAIASPSNPLTARVLVNRVWLHHFGGGLVNTASDFGLRSDPPTHPELLDLLAAEFVRNGWSIKTLHRRIMLSSTYQQRSDNNPAFLERDPQNRLLWKYNRQRLDFESMRDAMLAASGRLDPAIGGRPVAITEPPFPTRRTLYGFIDRQNLDGVFRTFDFPSPDATSPRRFVTTVPQQALFLMNSPFVIDQARSLVASVETSSADPEPRVRGLYRRALGREPEPREVELAARFVSDQESLSAPPPIWTYGVGELDASGKHVARFAPFAHWSGTTWQPAAKLPDPPANNYVNLNAAGGHTGPDARHLAIRRWTAPHDAVIAIGGSLEHPDANGDGVRGRIIAGRGGMLGDWVAHHAKAPTRIAHYEVKKGETIDFVVDCRHDDGFDTFQWSPVVREVVPSAHTWNARNDFEGPPPPSLSPWERFAQVLLLTNEFAFVD